MDKSNSNQKYSSVNVGDKERIENHRKLSTSLYQFRIKHVRINTSSGYMDDAILTEYAGTSDFFEYERYKRNNTTNLRLCYDPGQEIATVYDPLIGRPPLLPAPYWVSPGWYECIGTHLYGVYPVIVEFNGDWLRMYHDSTYDNLD